MKEWMTIRASIEVAGKTIFKNGNDSIYKNLTKMMEPPDVHLAGCGDYARVIWYGADTRMRLYARRRLF